MNPVKTNFSKIPNNIYVYDLKPRELSVLGYLISLSSNNTIYPSKKDIAKKTGISIRTVDKVIKSLKEKGFLQYNRRSNKNKKSISNEYNVVFSKIDPICIKESTNKIIIKDQNEADCNEMIRQAVREIDVYS